MKTMTSNGESDAIATHPILRPHSQQAWSQQLELQAYILHIQTHPPSYWAQSQSQLNKPQPEFREQPMQPSHWAQHVPQQLPSLLEPQTQSWMQQALPRPHIRQSSVETRPSQKFQEKVHWALSKPREQPQHPLHSSQPMPHIPPSSHPRPLMQESFPIPWRQTSLPEPHSQPEKTLPESGERVNIGEHFNFGENADNHDNNVNVEEPASFWTACPYFFHMYEYAGIYVDCTLLCQNC
ncbi:uncharacterized protein LOC141711550 isoform X1 [Apium graveolens]|uniref:uncharacterized protein LOC141711550 isoform X1 n=1 Tax=Apium graveolens TaxID=4045 RepID=UPI003D79CAA0